MYLGMEDILYNYLLLFGSWPSPWIFEDKKKRRITLHSDIYTSLLEDDEGMSTEAGRVRNCMIQKCYQQPKSHSGTKKINRHSEKS